jgi:hypothetical protein
MKRIIHSRHGALSKIVLSAVFCCSSGMTFAQVPDQQIGAQPVCKVLDPELANGRYQGPCQQGLAQGEGQVESSQPGGASYRGSFDAGRKQGHGRKTFANGDVYEGQWIRDTRDGSGRYIFGPRSPWVGDVYAGQWRADKMHGIGTYQWAGNESYSGDWHEGRPSETGTGGQARRAAYLTAFMAELTKTAGHVCATGRSESDPLYAAKGWVRTSMADRIFVEWGDGAGLGWQLVSYWRPCKAAS